LERESLKEDSLGDPKGKRFEESGRKTALLNSRVPEKQNHIGPKERGGHPGRKQDEIKSKKF